jgi:hypothetical protein
MPFEIDDIVLLHSINAAQPAAAVKQRDELDAVNETNFANRLERALLQPDACLSIKLIGSGNRGLIVDHVSRPLRDGLREPLTRIGRRRGMVEGVFDGQFI